MGFGLFERSDKKKQPQPAEYKIEGGFPAPGSDELSVASTNLLNAMNGINSFRGVASDLQESFSLSLLRNLDVLENLWVDKAEHDPQFANRAQAINALILKARIMLGARGKLK